MHKWYYLNKPGFIYLDDYQNFCMLLGLHIQSGLDIDTYMSLISKRWPAK